MASFQPQLVFGDFTLAEQEYFKQQSCVQLPPWESDDNTTDDATVSMLNGNLAEEQSCQPSNSGPSLQNDSQQQMFLNGHSTDFPALNGDTASKIPGGILSRAALKSKLDTGHGAVEDNGNILSNGDNLESEHGSTHASDNAAVVNGVEKIELSNGVADTEIPVTDTNIKWAEKDNEKSSSPKQSGLPPTASKQPATWASLFSGLPQPPKPVVPSLTTKPLPTTTALRAPVQQKRKQSEETSRNGLPLNPQSEVVDIEMDPSSKELADLLAQNQAVYKSPSLMPRGLINSSNWCYINATLQALLTSSPFCHLMNSFPLRQPSRDTNVTLTSTPTLDSFVQLVKELKPLPKKNFKRPNNEQFRGSSFEPHCIYRMLAIIKSKFAQPGRQEDAEEFLSCVLNRLHEEMLKVTEFYFGKNLAVQNSNDDAMKSVQTDLGYEVPLHDDEPDDNDANEDADRWEEVMTAKKNRSHVIRRADVTKTPVSDIFRGELRSDFSQEGQRGTATLEPFFALPLVINDQKTWSVMEALEHLTRSEAVHDFTNLKTKAKVEATRRQTLETLPPVLILHLKRFVYDKEGGLLKIGKEVQYHTDLVIGKELLSKSGKKITQDRRTYKLFAVVYHHGKEATGGHYSADVYHDGLCSWLRIDDPFIRITNVHEVVRHNNLRTAYLLFYKRTDLAAV